MEQVVAFPRRDFRARRVCSNATERSRVATINLAYLISHGVVDEQIYLTQYGLMAERHWREFRPKMVRELEAKGTLMEALFEAQEQAIEEMEAQTRKLETEQKLTPQQAHDRALPEMQSSHVVSLSSAPAGCAALHSTTRDHCRALKTFSLTTLRRDESVAAL
jgi:hypothetical protein